ncbi:uncharacterized protein LOC129951922 [Eupeodes corollae]|uniref:uncharacterized protein LOC129951922 n=1 Tax=Eupeodes corollae TaxID=290404 RepID=UPI00249352C7|nr:uncharacterized protein LOC129951922 [Eupeodes corollae]
MELDESNLHNKNTEQLVDRMMSFLEEPIEIFKHEDIGESKNPLCTGIKTIVGMFPAPAVPPQPLTNFNSSFPNQREDQNPFPRNSSMKENNKYEKACRHKDPYMHEVNRLMFCSTMGHPPHGSPEYFEAAENYALYGKEFLDFPIDIKFPRPMEMISCLDGDNSTQLQSGFAKSYQNQGFGQQPNNKYPNLGTPSAPAQLPVMLNPANYWASYPFYQTPNMMQPLMYTNPFLMTQYLNMFVRETQINTSIVQQHQFLSGVAGGGAGIQERLVYAQMLQQQIQTNQAPPQTQASFSSFSGYVGKQNLKLQDIKTTELNQSCDFMKNNLNGANLYEKHLELEE